MTEEVDWQDSLDQAGVYPKGLLGFWNDLQNPSQDLTLALVINKGRVALGITSHNVFKGLLHTLESIVLLGVVFLDFLQFLDPLIAFDQLSVKLHAICVVVYCRETWIGDEGHALLETLVVIYLLLLVLYVVIGVRLYLLACTGGLEPHHPSHCGIEFRVITPRDIQQTKQYLFSLVRRQSLSDLLLTVVFASVLNLLRLAPNLIITRRRDADLIYQLLHSQVFSYDVLL